MLYVVKFVSRQLSGSTVDIEYIALCNKARLRTAILIGRARWRENGGEMTGSRLSVHIRYCKIL
jgi:hypothetical protein